MSYDVSSVLGDEVWEALLTLGLTAIRERDVAAGRERLVEPEDARACATGADMKVFERAARRDGFDWLVFPNALCAGAELSESEVFELADVVVRKVEEQLLPAGVRFRGTPEHEPLRPVFHVRRDHLVARWVPASVARRVFRHLMLPDGGLDAPLRYFLLWGAEMNPDFAAVTPEEAAWERRGLVV